VNGRQALRAAAFSLVVTALATGCSAEPPVISRVFGRIIYVNDVKTGERSETLGVFLVASDPEGLEDLSAFYVIDDDAELFWKVDRSAWITSVAEGETWIGVSSLLMPSAAPFPAGSYRVVLQSVGGDTVEDTITVPARTATPPDADYPAATVDSGTIRIKGAAASCEVWVYGSDGAFSGAFPLDGRAPTLSVAAVTGSSPALAGGFTFRVFSWNPQAGYGVLGGPWSSGG
jgi:hypothetical protein